MADYITITLERTIDGVRYETYPKTITDQVFSADGVNLTDILANLVQEEEMEAVKKTLRTYTNVYRLRGILVNSPDISAIDKLYAQVGMQIGDVYLVQVNHDNTKRIMEQYVYTGPDYGWQFFGVTEASASPIIKEFPSELGPPKSFLMVSEDGTTLEFSTIDVSSMGESLFKEHNEDPNAHKDIREALANKADVNIGYNDILLASNWAYNVDKGYYQYDYTNENLPVGSYFTITPIIEDGSNTSSVINDAEITSSFEINSSDEGVSATLVAKYKPTSNIPIFVKVNPTINIK